MIKSTFKPNLFRSLVAFSTLLVGINGFSQGLFISQYIETSSGTSPKGVEIFNNTGADIVFSATNNLEIFQGQNGAPCSAVTGAETISGTLENGKVWVIGTANLITFVSGATDLSGTTAHNFNFNGDDAVQLYLGGVLMDNIGECGDDPGSSWSGGGVSTANQNIQTLYGTCEGTTAILTDPSLRYETVDIGTVMTGFGVAPKGCPFWTGATNTQWGVSSNWSSGQVPTTGAKIVIPTGTANTATAVGAVILAATTELTVESNANLTFNAAIVNNGTVTIKSGATLVQGSGAPASGTGTWNVEQDVLGGDVTSSVSGRFYYMGSPVAAATSAAFDAGGASRAWSYNESTAAFTEITDNVTSLNAGQGYGTIFDANKTINFTGGVVNNGAISITGLTTTVGTAPHEGFNLVSNPYASYLDWDAVTKTNIEPTIWFQTKDGSGNKVYDTYNSTSGVGVSNSGGVVNEFIAPMQGYWTEVTTGTGSLGLDNSMRSHQSAGSGLKSQAIDFPAFVRLNLIDGSTSDQTVVFFHEDAKDSKEVYDSRKMFNDGVSQLYSSINDENMMMNGLNFVEGTTRSVPLTMSLVGENDFTLNATELHMADGSVFLEDKSNGTMQDLSSNDSYTFAAPIGEVADRFVLHFVANGGLSIAEATKDDISIKADLMGNVTVSLSENLSVGGTITVLDAAGRQVSTKTITSATTQLNVSVPTGMYFVRVSNGSEVATEKIVIAQ